MAVVSTRGREGEGLAVVGEERKRVREIEKWLLIRREHGP